MTRVSSKITAMALQCLPHNLHVGGRARYVPEDDGFVRGLTTGCAGLDRLRVISDSRLLLPDAERPSLSPR